MPVTFKGLSVPVTRIGLEAGPTTRAGSPSLCEWAGSEPYTPNRSARERCERCSSRASSYFQSLWILRQACGASCGDLD